MISEPISMVLLLGVYDISPIIRRGDAEDHAIDMKMYYSDYFTFKFTVELFHNLYSLKNTFSNIELRTVKNYAPFLCSLGMGGFLTVKQGDKHSLMWTRRSNSISSGDMWHFSYDETVHVLKDAVKDVKGEIIISDKREISISPLNNMYRGLFEENGLHRDMLSKNRGILGLGLIMSDRLEVEVLSYAEVIFDPQTRAIQKLKQYKDSSPDGIMEISKLKLLPLGDYKELMGLLLTPESKKLADTIADKFGSLFSYDDTDKPLNGITRGVRTFIDASAQIGEGLAIDDDCEIPKGCKIGKNCKIAHNVTLKEGVIIGDNVIIEEYSALSKNCVIGNDCKLHRNVFVDKGVKIGSKVKIQNNVSVYHGVELEDEVFIGPNVVFTNDKNPRSTNDDGSIKGASDWTVSNTIVKKKASIGGGATIVCNVTIGEGAMIGAGAVVTKDVEAGVTYYGLHKDSIGKTFEEKQKIAQGVMDKFSPSYWWHLLLIALVVIVAAAITYVDYSYIVTSLDCVHSFNSWIKAIFALLILASTITVTIYAVQTIWQRHKMELDEYREFVKQVRDKLMNEKLFK